MNHDLLITKLGAYGFSHDALKFIRSYLKERKQRTKVGSDYSRSLEIKFGVPQGSILGPLLFNSFINDIFFSIKEISIANYADDNTTYANDKNVTELLNKLEKETNVLLEWFKVNEMKPNADKSHLLVLNNQVQASVKLGEEIIVSSPSVDLLGVKLEENLNFAEHITKLCKKGNQKLHALARISKFLSKDKLNNKINRLHERSLRLV